MECLSPIKIRNTSYGNRPDEYYYLVVPCGKCEACLKNRQKSWFVRLKTELKYSSGAYFFTLTYNDDYCDGNVHKSHLQDFFKRFRKNLPSGSLKYYLVSEYGPQTHRPHYHGILFFKDYMITSLEVNSLIEKCWTFGFSTISQVNDKRINYVSGYFLSKLTVPDGCNPIFSLVSKGIGIQFINDNKSYYQNKDYLNRQYVSLFGNKFPLPRYCRDKLFTLEERRKISKNFEVLAASRYDNMLESCGGDVHFLEVYRNDVKNQTRNYILRHSKKLNDGKI